MKTLEDRLDFYKELYYKEVDRRKDFNNAIIIPITLLTGVFSILFYLISAYNFSAWSFFTFTFIALFAISLVLFIICAYHSIRFYSNVDLGFKTIELPDPNEIETYRKSLWDFHKNEEAAAKVFTNWLIEQYIISALSYQKNNDLKATHYFQIKKFFIYGLNVLFLCGILFVQNLLANKSEKEEKLNILIELKVPGLANKTISIDTVINKGLIKNDSLTLILKEKNNGKRR